MKRADVKSALNQYDGSIDELGRLIQFLSNEVVRKMFEEELFEEQWSVLESIYAIGLDRSRGLDASEKSDVEHAIARLRDWTE